MYGLLNDLLVRLEGFLGKEYIYIFICNIFIAFAYTYYRVYSSYTMGDCLVLVLFCVCLDIHHHVGLGIVLVVERTARVSALYRLYSMEFVVLFQYMNENVFAHCAIGPISLHTTSDFGWECRKNVISIITSSIWFVQSLSMIVIRTNLYWSTLRLCVKPIVFYFNFLKLNNRKNVGRIVCRIRTLIIMFVSHGKKSRWNQKSLRVYMQFFLQLGAWLDLCYFFFRFFLLVVRYIFGELLDCYFKRCAFRMAVSNCL